MKIYIFVRLIFVACLLNMDVVSAYELATHARITEQSFQRSVLNLEPSLLQDFGIKDTLNAFGESYYDMSGSQLKERIQNIFEKKIMPNKGEDFLSIKGWLMRGAIREDDYIDIDTCNIDAPNPDDDKYPEPPSRPLNHFYDPAKDRPLTVEISLVDISLGDKAPDWALGTQENKFTQPLTDINADTTRRNHFTVLDAIEAMYRATTGHDKWNQPAGRDLGAPADATREDRNAYWATTFRSLGDMVHLVQDMSQPQHTRNDAHSGACVEAWSGHASVYESYIEARAIGAEQHKVDGTTVTLNALNYSGYPIPKFANYGNFWSTREGDNGRGLADYSNREFFSAGTNINDSRNDYLLPVNDASVYKKSIIESENNAGHVFSLSLLLGTVEDKQSTQYTKTNVPLSTESLFDNSLHAYGKRSYSLNKYNYDAMADLLIPRAVSYSAGLINHFFRGRLQVLQASKLGNELTLRFKNVSASDLNNNGITFNEGKFEVFYEDINGIMQPLTVTSSDLPSGDTTVATGDNMLHDTTYTFTIAHPDEENIALPPYTDASGNKLGTNTPFVLVFRGQIGQDAGIAVNAFARDGLLAYYGLDDDFSTPTTSFELQVTANPANAWRKYSLGPSAPATGLDPGWATYLGNNQITMNGGYGTTGTSDSPPTLFRSLDGGRHFTEEPDLTPSPAEWPLPKSYFQYTKAVFTGGASLATLRRVGDGSLSGTHSYRIYQSDDLGQNWVAGGLIDNVAQELDALVYLGESAGLKRYVTVAQHKALDDIGQLETKWVLLRSNNSGQSFAVEPITEVVTYAADNVTANGKIVHMGSDASGNAILGFAVKTNVYDAPNYGAEIKFYVSADSGISWVERSVLPASPRILAGKFPPTERGDVSDLLYLGTSAGGLPILYLSLTHSHYLGSQLITNPAYLYIKEFFLSNDGGVTWASTPGPDLGIENYTDSTGNVWERMTKFPWLVYPLDNGAIPGLYD